VRSLARDLAAALGTLGHLSALRRVASGAFTLDDAIDASRLGDASTLPVLMPPAAALRGRPCVTLNAQGVIEVGHGRALSPAHLRDGALPEPGQEPVGLLDERGELRALGRAEADRVLVIRGLHSPS
jgi:tRNA pseudouridine55 synthase